MASPFPSEHSNFLCTSSSPLDPVPLPCSSPWNEWRSPLKDEFIITAFWPPTNNVIHQYKAAHFNMAFFGNLVAGCQQNGTLRMGASYTEAFDCVAKYIPEWNQKLGLRIGFAVGFFNNSRRVEDMFYGGRENMGGLVDFDFTDEPPVRRVAAFTAPEMKWVHEQLRNRSLDKMVHAVLLHDDVVTNNAMTAAVVEYLQKHWPQMLPFTDTGLQGPDTLYQQRQPLLVPEEYMLSGSTTNVTYGMNNQLAMYANNQMVAERFGLSAWPLFNVGDGGGNPNLRSAPLVRVQAYGAVAYGARGLNYYCWGNGIWNIPQPNQQSGPGTPTVIYDVVRRTNADLTIWGQLLMKSRHVGAIRRPSVPHVSYFGQPETASTQSYASMGDHSTSPAAHLPVTAMDDKLLVGTFVSDDSRAGHLMVVDLRTDATAAPRMVALVLHPACHPSLVAGHKEGWSAEGAARHQWSASTRTLSLWLVAGGGALVEVRGCEGPLADVRQWWANPRAISLRPPNRMTNTPAMSSKQATYNRDGAAWRHFAPGGLAGWSSDFLVGGSFGPHGVLRAREAELWSKAGFLAASVAPDALATSLAAAAPYGLFLFPAPHPPARAAAASAEQVERLVATARCHPNLGGVVVADGRADVGAAAAAARALRRRGYMFLPLIPAVPHVARAVELAAAGVPLAAVSLPPLEGVTDSAAWAAATLARLAELGGAASNASNAMTMAVTLDACALASDSLVRFGAYASVVWGAQAIWWEGVGACAPIGSDAFMLIGGINRRIAQWAEPLFLKNSNEAVTSVRYQVVDVWSTSSLELPPLQGVKAARPSKGRLIEAMDDELVAVHLKNSTGIPGRWAHIILFISTAFSDARGGAPIRQLTIHMHSNVTSTKPVEPDQFQGWADLPDLAIPQGFPPGFFGTSECLLSWYGWKMPLQLAGGSTQLVTYTVIPAKDSRQSRVSDKEMELHQHIGRAPPRLAYDRSNE